MFIEEEEMPPRQDNIQVLKLKNWRFDKKIDPDFIINHLTMTNVGLIFGKLFKDKKELFKDGRCLVTKLLSNERIAVDMPIYRGDGYPVLSYLDELNKVRETWLELFKYVEGVRLDDNVNMTIDRDGTGCLHFPYFVLDTALAEEVSINDKNKDWITNGVIFIPFLQRKAMDRMLMIWFADGKNEPQLHYLLDDLRKYFNVELLVVVQEKGNNHNHYYMFYERHSEGVSKEPDLETMDIHYNILLDSSKIQYGRIIELLNEEIIPVYTAYIKQEMDEERPKNDMVLAQEILEDWKKYYSESDIRDMLVVIRTEDMLKPTKPRHNIGWK